MKQLIIKLKNNIGIIIIAFSFFVVIIIGLKNGILPKALDSIRDASPFFILLAICFYLLYILTNSIAQKSFINSQGYSLSIKESFYSAIASIYYANITPFQAGGMPSQIFYLCRQGIPAGVASASVMCFINAWSIMRLILFVVYFLSRYDFLQNVLGNNLVFLFIGFLYNLYIILIFFAIGFARKPVLYMVTLFDRIIRKLHIIKNPDKIIAKLTKTVETYHDAMQKILSHPFEIMKQLFFGLIYVVLLNSIIFLAYRSLGLSGSSYYDLLGLSICQNLASAYMPTPGGAGGQEYIYELFFGSIMSNGSLLAVMLIWRFITFYFSLFIGAIIVSVKSIHRYQ